MPVECFADEVAEEYDDNEESFGEMLRNLVQRNKQLEASHYAFGLSRLGLTEVKVRERWRDVVQAMNLVAIMGTPSQREAAEDEAKTAAAVLEKELPKLQEQRAEIEAKIEAIQRDARLSAKRVEHHREAVSKSREVVPVYIKKRVGAAQTRLNTEGVGATLREATARRHELVCVLNHGGVYDESSKHIDTLRRLLPDAVTKTLRGNSLEYRYSPEWPALKSAAEVEFAEVNLKLPELQAAYDEALAIVQAPLGYWTDPANWNN